jgi:preprotein translocase subunit SecG
VETILSVLEVIIAVVLVLLVLMHSGKDSGLSGAFGVGSGAGPLGGGSMVERNLNRWTLFLGLRPESRRAESRPLRRQAPPAA